MTRVFRGGSLLLIDGHFYSLSDCVDLAYNAVVYSGSKNPAFDMPPWFYSGSPYADAILALGVMRVKPPEAFQAEFVPKSALGWAARPPAWPEIFGVKVAA